MSAAKPGRKRRSLASLTAALKDEGDEARAHYDLASTTTGGRRRRFRTIARLWRWESIPRVVPEALGLASSLYKSGHPTEASRAGHYDPSLKGFLVRLLRHDKATGAIHTRESPLHLRGQPGTILSDCLTISPGVGIRVRLEAANANLPAVEDSRSSRNSCKSGLLPSEASRPSVIPDRNWFDMESQGDQQFETSALDKGQSRARLTASLHVWVFMRSSS